MQCVSSLQPASTCVFKLASFPHVYFDLAYFFLILEEEARSLVVARNLSGEGQVSDMFECRFEPIEVVSAKLEMPEVILCVPWALSLIVVRDCIQWPSILQVIPRNDANDMGIWSHYHPSVASRDASPPIVSDDTGHIVGPMVEIKA